MLIQQTKEQQAQLEATDHNGSSQKTHSIIKK
jgi:hypothetical protein